VKATPPRTHCGPLALKKPWKLSKPAKKRALQAPATAEPASTAPVSSASSEVPHQARKKHKAAPGPSAAAASSNVGSIGSRSHVPGCRGFSGSNVVVVGILGTRSCANGGSVTGAGVEVVVVRVTLVSLLSIPSSSSPEELASPEVELPPSPTRVSLDDVVVVLGGSASSCAAASRSQYACQVEGSRPRGFVTQDGGL